ncbi:hypothetical protein DIU36_30865, partial [Mucilaginibacter rubeus]
IPIGKPIGNTRVYILDGRGGLCGIGIPGELYISGSGLARGYLNRPDLTGERFLADPYGGAGSRMYRTGDVGRWLADGNIEYIGRSDDQVKIRGYRIEPGEIESVLQQSEQVSQGVVSCHTDAQGNKRLVGYVVAGAGYDRDGVMDYLRSRLPEYMVPVQLIVLESLPLTANGKIDRRQLPDPEESRGGGYVAATTGLEFSLVSIWEGLLDTEGIGVTDNFFELGGHSLLAIRVVSAIRRELG